MERRTVDIGGATLDAILTGSGPVTVVFENGLAAPLEEWDFVAPPIAARTRTLRYNRRRASSSGDFPAVRTATDLADDLERLLTALAVSPPYVIVGHSWGGVIARAFAHSKPMTVAGLVFVDATHEAADSRAFAILPQLYSVMGLAARFGAGRRWLLKTLCPPGSPPAYRELLEERVGNPAKWKDGIRTARSEGRGIRPSLADLQRNSPDLPPVPVHVLTAGGVSGPNLKAIQRVHQAWQATAAGAKNARYTNVPSSGHQMPMEAPDVVIEAITGVLDAVQHGRPVS
jgi:pimeloyl-ACP methyl ester carboxylesterase